LSECAANELSPDSGLKVRSMLAVTTEIGENWRYLLPDVSYLRRKAKEKIWFSPEQRANVKSMLEAVDSAFAVMIDNLKMPYENVSITEAMDKEKKINKMRDKFRKKHLATIEEDDLQHQECGCVHRFDLLV
jgi:phosphate:Na+ symporter